MANNYDPYRDEDSLLVYPCACGETLHLYPGIIAECCEAKGWELELPDEKGGEISGDD